MPKTYVIGSQRTLATDAIRDRVLGDKTSVFMNVTNGAFWSPAINVAFSQNTVGDPTVNTLYSQIVNMYPMIVRQLESQRLMFVRDTVLDNTGTSSLASWLNTYCTAFLYLRGLEGFLNAGNFNYTTSLISNAINQSLFRLEADLRRLYSYAVPPMLVTFLDRLCGPKALDTDSTVVANKVHNTAGPDDISLNTGVIQDLVNAEAALTLLTAPPAAQVADYQRIANTFALAYGEPVVPEPKTLVIDPIEYALVVGCASTFHDTVAAKDFSYPNLFATTTGQIPVLVPKGGGAGIDQLFSLLRTAIYTADPIAGGLDSLISIQIGLCPNTIITGGGSNFLVYTQGGVVAQTDSHGVAAVIIGYNSALATMQVWASEAAHEDVNYLQDVRDFRDWDILYVTNDLLTDETSLLIEKMFLDPIIRR